MTSKSRKPKSSKLGSLLGVCITTGAVLWSIGYNPSSASNCLDSSAWVTAYNNQQVNHAHIFCGELNRRGRLVGFHSRPGGSNPSTVAQFRITQSPNRQGIYAGEWTYQGRSQDTKFSTMFPDSCTASQVINSIGHAAANPVSCPANAPHWAWCGSNSPGNAADERFCHGHDGSSYIIAGANRSEGRINTAFPLRTSR